MSTLEHTQDSRERWLLWLLTAAALGLRLWGIAFGLPHLEARPDESKIIDVATRMWSDGPNPHFFNYPTLFIYVQSAALWLLVTVARSLGTAVPPDGEAAHMVGRLTSALTGAATIPLLYWSARRLFSREIATIAALFLTVAFLHVRDSHFGVTDVPATFMVMLAFVVMATRRVDWQHVGNALAASSLCGLAASTKYNAALVIAPLAVSSAMQAWQASRRLLAVAGLLGLVGVVAIAGFLAGTPFAAIDYPAFRAAFMVERLHLANVHAGAMLGTGWWHHLAVSLWYGLGWPLLLCALAGIGIVATRWPRQAAVVLAFPLVYYAVIGSGQTVFVRYALPLVPFLCLLAAVTVVWLAGGLQKLAADRQLGIVPLAVLTGGVCTLTAARSIAFDRTMAATDNRVVVTQWLEATFPTGAAVYQTGGEYVKLRLPPGFREWAYDSAIDVMHAPAASLPELVIVAASPLPAYTPITDLAQQVLQARYRTIARFDVEIPGRRGALVYDEQDAFFVPLSGFRAIRRPGPTLEVFGRR